MVYLDSMLLFGNKWIILLGISEYGVGWEDDIIVIWCGYGWIKYGIY